jgi:hypothetical protein
MKSEPDYLKFELAFWHPFGAHGKESPQKIIERKREEIAKNGWTFWSFQKRKDETFARWREELQPTNRRDIFVFCSDSRNALDPAREGNKNQPFKCQSYRPMDDLDGEWRAIPAGIHVPHPFRQNAHLASAFIVKEVIYPVETFSLTPVEWFSREKGPWRQDKIPTRGEHLIRPGGTFPMRKISAVLKLKYPYLAVLSQKQISN